MNGQKIIKPATNGLLKASGEHCQPKIGENVDDNKKIKSTFSHEK